MHRLVHVAAVLGTPCVALASISTHLDDTSWADIQGGRISSGAVVLGVNAVLLSMWAVVVSLSFKNHRKRDGLADASGQQRVSMLRTTYLWLFGAMLVNNAPGVSLSTPKDEGSSARFNDVMSPALAGAVVNRILARRREQIRYHIVPDRLTELEASAMARVAAVARHLDDKEAPAHSVTNEESRILLLAVDRISEPMPSRESVREVPVEVRVYGFPTVVAASGSVAEFRKGKALELLTWLVLNRDRSRRSTARTCIWDSAIHDSTFSTVISDMRRALTELDPSLVTQEWVARTYSDVISLSENVVSDYEVLMSAHKQFLDRHDQSANLMQALSKIRDVPFAGTNYVWADLDGTTTRLVIAALDACRDLAQWALQHKRQLELTSSVSAALRVMPGCEEFLELQDSYLASSYSYSRLIRR